MFSHFNFKMKGISELSLATNSINPFSPSHKGGNKPKKQQDRLSFLVYRTPHRLEPGISWRVDLTFVQVCH